MSAADSKEAPSSAEIGELSTPKEDVGEAVGLLTAGTL